MARLQKTRVFFVFTLVISFTVISVFPNRISGQVQPIAEVQEKLEGISDEEKAVLEALFTLLQEIEEMDREEAEITKEIETLQVKINDVEEKVEEQQRKYDNQLKVLKQVLVSYQKRGPASYLETLLSAKDLASFLMSLNVLKDLSRNVGELLDSVEELEKKLAAEKENLSENVKLLEDKMKELKVHMDKSLKLKEEQEAYLNSLAEEKEYYKKQLENLQQLWDEIKVLFSEIVDEFSRIMIEGEFPLKGFNLKFNFLSVRGTVFEETLNDVLKKNGILSGVEFHFYQDKVDIEVPEKHLALEGTFSIVDKSVLKFEVVKGSFYEMPLEAESIEELFRDGYLLIDFEELIGEYVDVVLKSIKLGDGYLEFEINPYF